ncbi:MAG: HlyD family secretion protein [Rhodomicrobium sp.]
MLKEDSKAIEALREDRLPSETGWQDWPGSDDSAYRQRWQEKLKVRAPSTFERPAVEAPQPDLPAEEKPAEPKKAQSQPEGSGGAARKSFLRRRPLTSAMAAILLAASVGAGYVYLDCAGHFETTDDAFIAARQIAIAPKVSGYVTQVPVTDNQHVPAGGVIARIDPRDYRIALEQANAQVAAAQDGIKNYEAQIAVQEAQIGQSKAQVDQAQASLTFAQQQAARYQHLAGTGYGSVQNAQQYTSQLDQQQAALKSAQAAVNVAERQIVALKAQKSSAEANLQQAIAQRDQAQLNLSYTTVTAAEPGRVVQLTAAPGELAQAGTNLTMFVPDQQWITANFKETQLDQMRPGDPVTMTIDAYPERVITGHVASVQPGSGTAFSLLPAQNATGNYVKIVQRVPVKIIIENPPSDVALGPGMSVEPTVRVNPRPSLYERMVTFFNGIWRQS